MIVAGLSFPVVSRYDFMWISQPIFGKGHYFLEFFPPRLAENVTEQTFISSPYSKIYFQAFSFAWIVYDLSVPINPLFILLKMFSIQKEYIHLKTFLIPFLWFEDISLCCKLAIKNWLISCSSSLPNHLYWKEQN